MNTTNLSTNGTPKSPEHLETELLAAQVELEQVRKRRARLSRIELWVVVGIPVLLAVAMS